MVYISHHSGPKGQIGCVLYVTLLYLGHDVVPDMPHLDDLTTSAIEENKTMPVSTSTIDQTTSVITASIHESTTKGKVIIIY